MLLGVELEGVDAKVVAAECLAAGLVVNGITSSALRLAPPLTISDEHLDEGVAILDGVIDAQAPVAAAP
jgi:4-aminobutyrate aminotransferase-like enzyme